MRTGEIEDFLSAIRRLVSEDLRTPPPEARAQGAAPVAGKLLLTPAFRVAPQIVHDKPETAPPPRNGAQQAPAPALDAEVDGFEDQDWSPEAELAAAEAEEEWPELDAADFEAAGGAPFATGSASAPQADVEPSGGSINKLVSEIAAAVSASDDEWEAETGDLGVSDLSWKAPEWVEEAEVIEKPRLTEAAAAAQQAARAARERAEAAALAEDEAELEAELRAHEAQAEAATLQPQPGADVPAKPVADDLFAEDEGYFDETVLRDLVRDLIREELSGTLGERITRNVRKLVRAEINRALVARDFD